MNLQWHFCLSSIFFTLTPRKKICLQLPIWQEMNRHWLNRTKRAKSFILWEFSKIKSATFYTFAAFKIVFFNSWVHVRGDPLNSPPLNCYESWKVLSQNFRFLEIKSPGNSVQLRKFSQNNFTKNGHSGNVQSWNFAFLEFILVQELSVPGILFHRIYLLPF